MKVAYLIIAHNQPGLLARLVKILTCEWAYFFIHIDAKTELSPFQRRLDGCQNIMFVEDAKRVNVQWGGFSQVQATLNLLDTALNFDNSFSRYTLLSGSDFPIKPLAVIRERFGSNQEFMRIDRRLKQAPSTDSHSRAAQRYYFMDLPLPRMIKLRFLSGWIPRRLTSDIPLYHGAQWWSLTGACIQHIMKFVQETPSYATFCRHLLSSDEIFFHSIVKESPFAGRISHDFERVSNLAAFSALNDHGCHYIDWNVRQKVLPKTLTQDDLPALHRSFALFARKFDEIKSLELLQILENEVKTEGNNSVAADGGMP